MCASSKSRLVCPPLAAASDYIACHISAQFSACALEVVATHPAVRSVAQKLLKIDSRGSTGDHGFLRILQAARWLLEDRQASSVRRVSSPLAITTHVLESIIPNRMNSNSRSMHSRSSMPSSHMWRSEFMYFEVELRRRTTACSCSSMSPSVSY